MNALIVLLLVALQCAGQIDVLVQGDPVPGMIQFRMDNGDTLLCHTDGVEQLGNGWDPSIGLYSPADVAQPSYSFSCTEEAVRDLPVQGAFEVNGTTYTKVQLEVAFESLREGLPTIGA